MYGTDLGRAAMSDGQGYLGQRPFDLPDHGAIPLRDVNLSSALSLEEADIDRVARTVIALMEARL